MKERCKGLEWALKLYCCFVMCRGGWDGFQRVLVCVLCLLIYRGVALPPGALRGAGVVTVAAQEVERSWQGLFSDLK